MRCPACERLQSSGVTIEGLFTLSTYLEDRLVWQQRRQNKITFNGKSQFLMLWLGQSFHYGLGLAWGENGTPQTVDDLGLFAERLRTPLVSVSPISRVGDWARLTIRARLGKTQGNGFTYQEASLVTKLVPGTVADGDITLARVTFSPEAKTDQKFLLAQWQFTMK